MVSVKIIRNFKYLVDQPTAYAMHILASTHGYYSPEPIHREEQRRPPRLPRVPSARVEQQAGAAAVPNDRQQQCQGQTQLHLGRGQVPGAAHAAHGQT